MWGYWRPGGLIAHRADGVRRLRPPARRWSYLILGVIPFSDRAICHAIHQSEHRVARGCRCCRGWQTTAIQLVAGQWRSVARRVLFRRARMYRRTTVATKGHMRHRRQNLGANGLFLALSPESRDKLRAGGRSFPTGAAGDRWATMVGALSAGAHERSGIPALDPARSSLSSSHRLPRAPARAWLYWQGMA